MRGAPAVKLVEEEPVRIIPADAGSTHRQFRKLAIWEDHPRRCGEHVPPESLMCMQQMRGALGLLRKNVRPNGIIPADAGSTVYGSADVVAYLDHPRGCGEHPGLMGLPGSCGGSSPRMRGALLVQAERAGQVGIIPADAGSTRSSCQCFGQ